MLDSPKHGYEIKRSVDCILGKDTALNNNVLYPALKRFEKGGFIRKNIVQQKGKPSRSVYHLTPSGKKKLQALLVKPSQHQQHNRREFMMSVIYMHLLSPTEKRNIIENRRANLQYKLERLFSHIPILKPKRSPYFSHFFKYINQQIKTELKFLSELEKIK